MSSKKVSLQVSPVPSLKPTEDDHASSLQLTEATPRTVVAGPRAANLLNISVQPTASSCFGPRGVAVLSDGTVILADTGHHRVLAWRDLQQDQAAADWVFGQPDFCSEGRNAKSTISAVTLNVPTGVCAAGEGFAVADAWNHRVLIWDCVPSDSNHGPDRVLGQANFTSGDANHGNREHTTADACHWPYGVYSHAGKLYVADAENRRVLIWNDFKCASGKSADCVLGQPSFRERNENAGSSPSASSMRWPHDITVWCGNLCVADAGNNRIMIWNGIPTDNDAPCTWVLGQASHHDVEHNQSLYWPRANTLNMPYGITAVGDWLFCADTANSRVLAWHIDELATNAPARFLLGQRSFADKGDNRWQPAVADSLCWPYGIASDGSRLLIADSGNNRISVWNLTS